MKLTHSRIFLLPLLLAVITTTIVPESFAAPRHRPANPLGAADPRGIRDPRGVFDPRGVRDPRGIFDPRGPFDPRNPHRYMYGLPAGYVVRVYSGVTYYYCGTTYYYLYYINGQAVYVKTTVVNGVPVIPPRPY